jgi:hypothetical protein
MRKLIGLLYFILAASCLADSTIWVCTSKCDVRESSREASVGGKASNTTMHKELHTFVFQTVASNEQEAFTKLTNKCKGQLYVGKNETSDSDYVKATIENACDHN